MTNYETKNLDIERHHLKNTIIIFLNKLIDTTESEGIKNLISDFFRKNLRNVKKRMKSLLILVNGQHMTNLVMRV